MLIKVVIILNGVLKGGFIIWVIKFVIKMRSVLFNVENGIKCW